MTDQTETPSAPAPADGGGGAEAGPSWFQRHRFGVAMTLVVLGAIIGLVSTATIWVKRQALNNDAWTNTTQRMLQNDEIRGALSQYIVDQAFAQSAGIRADIAQALPKPLQPLAAPLAASLQSSAPRVVDALLQRPRVQALWVKANQVAHQDFVDLVEGNRGIVLTDGTTVSINLQEIVKDVRDRLGLPSAVGSRLPPTFVVMNNSQLQTARDAVKFIKFFSVFLVLVVLALWIAAVWIAVGRRRSIVMAIGLSALVLGLIVLMARRIAGQVLVDALAGDGSTRGAAAAAWAIGTDLLRDSAIAFVSYGLLIVIGAWLAGPSRAATAVRRFSAPAMRARPAIVLGVAAAVFLVILLLVPSGGRRLIGELILFAGALGGVWALRQEVVKEFPGDDGGPAAA